MQRKLSREVHDIQKEPSKDSIDAVSTSSSGDGRIQKLEPPSYHLKTRSKISRISQIQHTELFDISENSKSTQKCGERTVITRQVSATTDQTTSQFIFWDESSTIDVTMLRISEGPHGKRQIDKILISTDKYASDAQAEEKSDDFFSSLV
ncbi:Hypothetical_protein [Hexamita inflata]|uniref:Hypothetical_protein n=1 Tax=Hexamita inflata TaxID=28002 RepID=A0AA86V572_9EUKA|nr:Hypothetical protein HINF_LOCUS64367 [Hexamita inflata]